MGLDEILSLFYFNKTLTIRCYNVGDNRRSLVMDWRERTKRVLFLHELLIFFMVNISAAGLIFLFINGLETHFIAYLLYAFSFYTLIIVCVRIPGIIKWWKRKLHENKYTDKYLTDADLRMRISMYRGLLISFVFATFKIILGFVYDSSWFFAMAGYNMILSIMRFILVLQSQKKGLSEEDERKQGLLSYRLCGWLMLVLNVAVSVLMFMVIVQNQKIEYHMIACIGLAAFTFYCFTRAVINMIKYKRQKNPIYAAVKRLDMVKAIVSIFTLQVAMLTTFQGQGGELDVGIMNMLTGIAVTIAINTIGAMMIAGVKGDFRVIENVEV